MNHVQPIGHSFLWLVIAASMMLWSGCSLRMPLQSVFFGSIEPRKTVAQYNGIVIGSPDEADPVAAEYARAIGAAVGAGFVVDRGSRVNLLTTVSSSTRSLAIAAHAANFPPKDPPPSFKSVLRSLAAGPGEFYVGVEAAGALSSLTSMEVTTTGMTVQQIEALRASYARISVREAAYNEVPVVEVTVQSVDDLSWNEFDVERRSILALVARGLDIRLPPSLSDGRVRQSYQKMLSLWIRDAVDLMRRDPDQFAMMKVVVSDYGKFESIPGDQKARLVIGAPHGTFDPYTARVVRQICARIGLPGVIARGFTPAETGGWRINVNRPTERHVATDERESETARAGQAYRQFKESVLAAVAGNLDLYVEIHQNSGQRIEVATVGISREAARFIKEAFQVLRDAALFGRSDVAPVELAIEPIDELEVGAWAAKTNGILTLAKQSLHFELPSYGLMGSALQRNFYTPILAELILKIIPRLQAGR